MKVVLRALGLILVVAFAWWAIQMVAAESGEVVVVRTNDAQGRPHETRLWIVDQGNFVWLRAGSEIAGWYQRLSETREVVVERDGQTVRYVTEEQPWQREIINQLMLEKYGWAERYIGFVFDRDHSIPIRLRIPED